MLLKEEVNDYDVYFTNKNIVIKIVKYYIKNLSNVSIVEEGDRVRIKIPSRGIEEILKKDAGNYTPIYITDNAITLKGDVQLIIRFYGEPEEIHKNYDFIHATNYWLGETEKLTLNNEAIQSLLKKELVYFGSKYPVASLIRTRKFIKRGFSCNAGEFLKIAFQISKLDLSNFEVLKEQLIGVDVAYFEELLSNLKNKDTIDYTYIMELINKIF